MYNIGMSGFNHNTKSVDDTLHLIGELELVRKHAVYAAGQFPDDEVAMMVLARRAKAIRRSLMPEVGKQFHCILKHLSTARELSYEVYDGDNHVVKQMDEMVQQLWLQATGEDLELCSACVEDKIANVSSDVSIKVVDNDEGDWGKVSGHLLGVYNHNHNSDTLGKD